MANNYIESNIIEYNDVKTILGYDSVINGETDDTYFEKRFRYSSDGILWSDYKILSNKSLSSIVIYENKIYIQYRFTKIGDGELSVESISLDVEYINETDNGIPDCHWSTYNKKNRYSPSIVFESNGLNKNIFNPYAIGNAYNMYAQLSTLVSNMFGICVLYFKTEANSRTRDVVLKEYSIEHVIDKNNIKILIPDNQLPTRELQFNSMMIDYPVQFEIHIVKSEFQKIFGTNSHPDPHDYLYMEAYMNKMYMIDSVSEPDDFGYSGAYWRVSLVPYQELSSIKFSDDNLLEDTESLIFSAEGKFNEEFTEEIQDTRKDNQLNDMGDWQEGQDFLRRYLEPNVRIRDEKIYNDWTVFAQQYYDLSTIDKGLVVNEYKYSSGFSNNDERMITFWFRPNDSDNNISENIIINSISKGNNGIKLKLKRWNKNLVKGNYIKISRTSNLDGFKKIINVSKSSLSVEIDGEFNQSIKLFNCAKIIAYDTNEMINIKTDYGIVFDISQISNQIIININGSQKIYSFDGFSGFEDKWYAMVLGMNRGLSNIWLYELDGSEKKENRHSKLKLVGKSSNDFGKFDFGDICYYDIMSCNASLTNFRLWSKLCAEDTQELILSQYVVDDTHNTLIVDNAQSELLLNNKWS